MNKSPKIIANLDSYKNYSEQHLNSVNSGFLSLIRNNPFGMYLVNENFKIIEVSQGAQKVFQSINDLIGRDIGEVLKILWLEPFATEAITRFRHTLASGEPYVAPCTLNPRRNINTLEAYDWRIEQITLPDGQKGIICYFYNLTERHEWENALRKSEERLKLATEATGVGIWQWNVITGQVIWDAQMFRIYGIPPAEVNYETWSNAVFSEDLIVQEELLQKSISQITLNCTEFRILRPGEKDHRNIQSIFTVMANVNGKAEWVLGTNLDVTERKRNENALIESESRFRMLADNIPQLAWIADSNLNLVWFNKRWLEYTGTTLEENLGVGWKAVHHPDYLKAVAEKFERHLLEGIDWHDTFPLRSKNGEYRWFLSRMSVIRDESGKILRFFGTNTDVTEERQMAENLQQLTAELSEASKRKDEFLATLAHELRNPLAPVRTGLQVLKLLNNKDQQLKKTREMMERQVSNMVRLIDDLLDVSRISSGKVELKREQINLVSAIESAIEGSRPFIDLGNHTLILDFSDNELLIYADPIRLTQIISNLLNNAAKYTQYGGRIELSLKHLGSDLIIKVKDNGIGIDSGMLTKIFDIFTQINVNMKGAQGGLGIGLSLVKHLVQLHGGTVTAESLGIKQGSTFTVSLPIVHNLEKVVIAKDMPTTPNNIVFNDVTKNLKILVVDDNVDSAESMSLMLQLSGYETAIAYNGYEALQIATTFQPEVVFLDIGLPSMDGYEVAKSLRNQPINPLTLVALTGWGSNEDRRRSKEAGFNYHLTKPVESSEVDKLLDKILKK
jgi:PAS domain S-box-containing protein